MAQRVQLIKSSKPTPFVKGNRLSVGNKGGGITKAEKYKRRFATQVIIHALEKKVRMEIEKLDGTNATVIVPRIERMVDRMCDKVEREADVPAFRELLDRAEGKVPQEHEMGTKDGMPIPVLHGHMNLSEMARLYAQALIERKRND